MSTGIEFWSNVCDEEVDLEIERSEAEELGKPPENVSRFYAKVILSLILGRNMNNYYVLIASCVFKIDNRFQYFFLGCTTIHCSNINANSRKARRIR